MENPGSNFRESPKEKKESVFNPKQEFDKLSREALDLYNGAFSSSFAELTEVAEDFEDIDVEGAKYLTLRTFQKEVAPVVSKFLKAMNGCKKACEGLEGKFRAMVDLAKRYPELLKLEKFVAEVNETELRINDTFVKLEKYKKMLSDVETVVNAWPDTSYNPLKAVYQTVQRPIGWGWKEFVGEKSVLNKLAARARVGLEEVVYNFIMDDEYNIVPKAEGATKAGGKVVKKIAKKAVKEVTDFVDGDDE